MIISCNGTLGTLPGSYRLHFHCSDPTGECRHNKRVDIDLLIRHLGERFICKDLYEVLRCPVCKGRKFLIIYTPVHHSYPSHNK